MGCSSETDWVNIILAVIFKELYKSYNILLPYVLYCIQVRVFAASADPEGGQGVRTPPPPWKITSYLCFYSCQSFFWPGPPPWRKFLDLRMCRMSENSKSFVMQDKCNIEIFLSPGMYLQSGQKCESWSEKPDYMDLHRFQNRTHPSLAC